MKRALMLTLGLSLCAHTAHAAPPSLFFAQPALETIDQQVRKNPTALASQSKHLLHLGSILYFSPANWAVWIQGEKWTPESAARSNVRIVSVQETAVRLNVALQGDPNAQDVTLHPHQSLNLLTGKIVEGF